MNFLATTIIVGFLSGLAFFFFGGDVLITNATMLLSFEAIIVAAVLVRLNRGIPSLEWKYVDVDALERLLDRIEKVAIIYVVVVVVAAMSILALIAAIFVNTLSFPGKLETMLALSTTFGALLGILLARMANVVWLDLDILRLQKSVILSAARVEQAKEQTKVADEKIAMIRSTRIGS